MIVERVKSYSVAFFWGSLFSAFISLGIAFKFDSHIGRCLSFLIIGTGSGLILSAIGLVILLIASCHKDITPDATSDAGMLFAFFFPIIFVLGGTWLISLGTSAT